MKNLRYNERNNHKCLPSPRVCRNYSEIKVKNQKIYPYSITPRARAGRSAGFSDGESEEKLVVARSYNNADTQKSEILKENSGKSGVYL